MALSTKDVEMTYEALTRAAQENQLGWVQEEVAEKIALGKTTTTKVSTKASQETSGADRWSLAETGADKRGGAATFITAVEYSPRERLLLLIDALLIAVPAAHQVAQQTLVGMRKFGHVDAIAFVPDLPDSQPKELRVGDLARHSEAVEAVERLLKELKDELEDENKSSQ